MTSEERIIQAQVTQFIAAAVWRFPVAVTLTLKQGRPGPQGLIFLNPDIASSNVRHFLNLLNCSYYGKAARKAGARIQSFAVRERGGEGGRLHYHLLLENPGAKFDLGFSTEVRACWARTHWAHREVRIDPFPDDGWIAYMAKYEGGYADKFDWSNTFIVDGQKFSTKADRKSDLTQGAGRLLDRSIMSSVSESDRVGEIKRPLQALWRNAI